ncbi:uncharacterized protein G6M90_00g055230 [Metarhizium brunneum]|uniref:Uncharacterized protein n=1 Tax=Metarhizium brunneum TaxID=500148 RepID=A0A7D5UXB7_9HYPO|nr:hypothetical protein G6M90_00g055230 [Metarhizium brunneum]
MVRPWIPALVWLAASDISSIPEAMAPISSNNDGKTATGSFIIECKNSHEVEKLANNIKQAGGEVLDKFNSRFFYGLSVGSVPSGMDRKAPAEDYDISPNAEIKSELERDAGGQLRPTGRNSEPHQSRDTGNDAWHLAMTQVDKMRKEGFTGTGIKPDPIKAESVNGKADIKLGKDSFVLGPGASETIEVIVNGTDSTSLSIPYLCLAGALRSAGRIYPGKPVLKIAGADGESTYPSTDAFVFNDPQSGQKPGPSNSVERKDAGVSLDKVFVAIHLPLASPKLRLDMVPLTLCSSSPDFKPQNTSQAGPDLSQACVLDEMVTKFAGTKCIGQLSGSPFSLFSRQSDTINITHWNGSFAPGQYAPPGRYQFALHALALFGNPDNESDWHTSLSNDFSIAYKHKIKL